jgi:hypothetical protein
MQDDEGGPAGSTEVPAITLHPNAATLDTAGNAQELRAYVEKARLDARKQTRDELLQIDEDARLANEEMAEQSGADWQQAQASYLEGLEAVRELDLDVAERNRREAELAAAKEKRLVAISDERVLRSRKIQADREARRESTLLRAAEFDASLQGELTKRVELLQATPKKEKETPAAMVKSQLAEVSKFDIYVIDVSRIGLVKPRLRGAVLRADEINLSVFLKNRGKETFALANNQIDASIIEGYFDVRERTHIDRRGVSFYPARGLYDIVVESDAKVEVPLIIKGPRQNRVGLWPVPMPNRHGAGLRAVQLSSGEGPVELTPEVWHTITILLVPADADQGAWNHRAFANIRFDRQGGIQELKGPYFY